VGQQQLLLIVLGVIIVGVAVVVGINIYQANERKAILDSLTTTTLQLATQLMEYYKKPATFGGGGGSYNGWPGPGGSWTHVMNNDFVLGSQKFTFFNMGSNLFRVRGYDLNYSELIGAHGMLQADLAIELLLTPTKYQINVVDVY
jgi:hypothetical protein